MSQIAARFELSFPQPHTHYVDVKATYAIDGRETLELMMAVWTPGSYLVREYARNVEGLTAVSGTGATLPVRKTRKNRWSVALLGATEATVSYRVYCRQMTTQCNWVSSEFAMLNGAPTFIVPVDRLSSPVQVRVEPNSSWTKVVTALQQTGDRHTFLALDFDELVDSPIYVGNAPVHEFSEGGALHLLVNQGEEELWDGQKAAADAAAIVREAQRMWGVVPYDRYVFFNMIVDARGGLEHKFSTLLMTSRYAMRKRKDYADWLALVAHEFFHTWNVKRMRPEALGPFDYENEVHTPDLWIAEGFTNYYDELIPRRAGLVTRDEFFDRISDTIEALQTTPGRLVQPMSSASYDAWISLYRRDENTNNVAISYYTKGAVIAMLLDAEIRRLTGGAKSLDDLMLAAWPRFSGDRGFRSDEFRTLVFELTGTELGGFFTHAVDSAEELDYEPLLEWFGLKLAPKAKKSPNGETKAWLGLVTSVKNGQLVVDEARRGTPGYDAGLNAEDEIIAVDDYRVPPDKWEDRLEHYRPQETATLVVSRRGKLERIAVTFGEEPEKPWRLSVRDDASEEQKLRLSVWLRD